MSRAKVNASRESLNILFIAAEADPFVKVGGLGDVAGSLPRAIANLSIAGGLDQSIDIRLAIPYYPQIREGSTPVQRVTSYTVDSIHGPILAEVYSTVITGITTYLISGEPVTRNTAVYGADFKADAEKFVFFSLACLALPHALEWKVDILHANDWHTATAIHALKTMVDKPRELKTTRSILTVHNLPFMGAGSEEGLSQYNIPPAANRHLPHWAKTLPLPMGLAAADQIVAVSPTYAREILTPEYGCDLQDLLKTRKNHISGILNGLDVEIWDPATDPKIEANFNCAQLKKKKINKTALQKEFRLDQDETIPLLVLISRMDPQKGIDIAIEGLRMMKDVPFQAILLGTGMARLENACRELAEDFSQKIRASIQFNTPLSHRMYAGADILLMPSRYEPCGLAQMIAMRYGTVPVARATGGLVDSIIDESAHEDATGFLFSTAEPVSFSRSLQQAMDVFKNNIRWNQLMRNAMSQDFSWSRSALEYINLYISLGRNKRNKRG